MKKSTVIPFWTTRQLAHHYDVSHVTVATWIKEGKLPFHNHPFNGTKFWLKHELPTYHKGWLEPRNQ
jgi:hypothetical protein